MSGRLTAPVVWLGTALACVVRDDTFFVLVAARLAPTFLVEVALARALDRVVDVFFLLPTILLRVFGYWSKYDLCLIAPARRTEARALNTW